MSAQEICDHPKFFGLDDEAEALSVLARKSGKTPSDIVELVVSLKKPAAGPSRDTRRL